MVVPFTTDKNALVDGINGLEAGGDTALYQAVGASAFAAGSSGMPRTAIVVLSDGENDTPILEATEQSSLAAVSSARVPVYTISFGDAADPAYLGRLAAATNGRFFTADEAGVASVYALLAEQLRGQYALTLRSAVPPDGAKASLVVTVDVAGQQVSSVPFSFVRGEAPPAPPPPPGPSTATEEGATEGGTSSAIPLVLAGLVGLVLLAMAVGFGARTLANRRRQRQREREAGQHSDTPLPAPVASPTARAPEIQARIVALSGQGAGLAVEVGTVPIVIGSDEAADLRVERAGDIAPRHAQVWVRDGKIMLRHVGGQKKTMAMGRPVDWLILDEGDEFSVGPYQYRVEAAHTNGAGS